MLVIPKHSDDLESIRKNSLHTPLIQHKLAIMKKA